MVSLKPVRRAGCPLVAIETSDNVATVKSIMVELANGKSVKQVEYAFLSWDFARGAVALNKPGESLLLGMLNGNEAKPSTQNPNDFVQFLAKVPDPKDKDDLPRPVIFWHNAQRFWGQNGEMVVQGVSNLRDYYKQIGATLVLLCTSAASLPEELKHDMVILTDPLPTLEQVAEITKEVSENAGFAPSSIPDRPKVHDTLLGLSEFEAEQVLALSMSDKGIDMVSLRERKVRTVEQTKGLTIHRGTEKFSDVGGLANGKDIIGKTITGRTAIRAIVLIDEIDKALAASRSDSSGTTQDQLKVLLTYMEDSNILGVMFNGPPGTGKTSLCKAAAGEHDILLISLDLGAMKEKFVGSSEDNLRQAIKVIHAITGGKVLFVGSCNRAENLPPELRRRFNYATLFFDLPNDEERAPMWKIWRKKYEIAASQIDRVEDTGWTGAEVRNCCLKSWAMGCKLSEAAKSIVPVSVSAKEEVEALRRAASGKYISASKPGLYVSQSTEYQQPTGRRMER